MDFKGNKNRTTKQRLGLLDKLFKSGTPLTIVEEKFIEKVVYRDRTLTEAEAKVADALIDQRCHEDKSNRKGQTS